MGKLTDRETLRNFLNDAMVIRLPRWVWWGCVVLVLLPLAVAL